MNEENAPSLEEVAELFFGDDSQKKIDLSAGRPSKKKVDPEPDVKEIEELVQIEIDIDQPEPESDHPEQTKKIVKSNKNKKSKSQLEQEALIKQAKFLNRFEQKIQKRKNAEISQLAEKEIRRKNKDKRLEKRRGKLNYFKNPRMKYAPVNGDNCEHSETIESINDTLVTSVCIHCSRKKTWNVAEWIAYRTTADGTVTNELVNPDKNLFRI